MTQPSLYEGDATPLQEARTATGLQGPGPLLFDNSFQHGVAQCPRDQNNILF